MASHDDDRPTRARRPAPPGWPLPRRAALAVVLLLIAAVAVPALALAHHKDGHDGGPGSDRDDGDDDGASSGGLLDNLMDAVGGGDGGSDGRSGSGDPPGDEPANEPDEGGGAESGEDAARDGDTPQAALPRFRPDAGREGGGPVSGAAAYLASGAGGLALLGLALGIGRRAAGSNGRRPRSALEAARGRALQAAPTDAEGVVQALRRSRYAKVLHARVDDGTAEVSVKRKRGVDCGEVSSYVTGLLESAWGHDVDVDHHECAGKKRGPCAYRARARVPAPEGAEAGAAGPDGLSGSARPGEGASTRGSSPERRRSG